MSDWLRKFQRSRRARVLTLGGLSVMLLGSCGGAVIANYTVAGMNLRPYSGSQYASSDWREDEPEWVRDAAMVATGDTAQRTDFASGTDPAYSDASY